MGILKGMAWADPPNAENASDFLLSSDEMGRLIDAHSWLASPLGQPDTWPQPLRTTLSTCLGSPLATAVLWGPDHRLLYNQAYATLLAGRYPSALGHPFLEVWSEIGHRLAPQLAEVLRTGRGFTTEEARWLYSFAPIRGEDGSVAGIFNTAVEMTSRIPAEQTRSESERRTDVPAAEAGLTVDFRSLFEAAPTPLLALAPPDWTIIAANDARLQVTNTTREDQIGRKLFDLFPDDPGDLNADGVRNLTASLQRVMATRAADVMKVQRYDVREPDGRFVERWWSPVNMPVLREDGEVALVVHRAEDVTEVVRLRGEAEARNQLARDQQAVIDRLHATSAALQQSEERNRRIVEGLKDYAVFTTDLEGVILDWTLGAEAIFGWPGVEIVGKMAGLLFTPEDRAAGVPARELQTARETGYANDKRWHIRRDGSRFFANGSVRPLHNARGEIAGFIKIARDETEQRAVEERLRESEEFNRRVLASSADCIKVLDLDARLTFMSEGGQGVMEVGDFNAIRGCPWPDFWHGEGHEDALAAVTAARAGGAGHFRGPANTLAGTPKWWDVQVTPILGADGRPERLLSVSRDITAMHTAETALRDSEAHWRGLFERLQEGIILGELVRDTSGHVIDWRYLDVNPAWGKQVGIQIDRAIGRTIREMFPGIEDMWVNEMAEVVETGRPTQFLRQVGAIGRWYEGRAFRLAEDRFAVLFVEVTERKLAEDRRTALLDLNDRLRGVTDLTEMVFVASEVVGRALQATSVGYATMDADEDGFFIERDWTAPGIASIEGHYRMQDFGSYVADLRRGEAVSIRDVRADPRTTGNAAALEGTGARAFINLPVTEQGRLVAVLFVLDTEPRAWAAEELAFARGVAERTRAAVGRQLAEQRLHELAASLEQQVEDRTRELMTAEAALRQSQKMEAVGQLTGGLAHDFNNLLTGVTGSLELLQTRIAQGRIKDVDRYVNAAQGAAKRAAALTHRLLAFSRRQTLAPKPTDMNRLVASMEELIRRTVGPEIAVETVAAGGLWTTLVDPSQLENALLNLCINARDAMPEGGRLTVETGNRWLDARAARERELPPGQYVSLCVSDNGTGMPPEVIARAFDPFFTTKPIGQGTGLGLSMIYGFVRQSNGQARIYSEMGQGTMLCLYLPRYHGAAEEADASPELSAAPRAGRDETVLIVDDEPTVRMLVTEVLEDLGYTAIEAADGAAGLRVLRSNARIDLLVTDVGLPGGLNGRQVADAARVVRPELKVLFITGYAENAVLSHGHLEPGMHILTKPFAMEALASRIREMIAGS